MYYVTADRERLVEFLPKGAVAAEIGVAQGDFAAVMLEKCAPYKLHLIDPWRGYETGGDDGARGHFLAAAVAERAGGAAAPALHTSAEHDRKFRDVQDRFRGDTRLQIHRTLSYRAAPTLPDKHFDFVYLDGDHTYEYVLRDLLDYAAEIKDDGLILGHDYFEDAFAAKENYAVIGAVNAFLARTGFIFAALTWDKFPTYVLAALRGLRRRIRAQSARVRRVRGRPADIAGVQLSQIFLPARRRFAPPHPELHAGLAPAKSRARRR